MLRVKVSKAEYEEATGGPDYSTVAPMTCPSCGIESHPWLAHTHTDNKITFQDTLYHSTLFKNRDGHYVFDRGSDGTVYPAHWHMSGRMGVSAGDKVVINGERCRGGKTCPQSHRATMVRLAEDQQNGVLGRQWTKDEIVDGPDLSSAWNPFNE